MRRILLYLLILLSAPCYAATYKLVTDASELKDGDVLFILAGDEHIIKIAGLLRNYLGEELELTDHNRFEFCIVNDFPFFEYNEEDKKWDFGHNPFSMPQGGLDALNNQNPLYRKPILP